MGCSGVAEGSTVAPDGSVVGVVLGPEGVRLERRGQRCFDAGREVAHDVRELGIVLEVVVAQRRVELVVELWSAVGRDPAVDVSRRRCTARRRIAVVVVGRRPEAAVVARRWRRQLTVAVAGRRIAGRTGAFTLRRVPAPADGDVVEDIVGRQLRRCGRDLARGSIDGRVRDEPEEVLRVFRVSVTVQLRRDGHKL